MNKPNESKDNGSKNFSSMTHVVFLKFVLVSASRLELAKQEDEASINSFKLMLIEEVINHIKLRRPGRYDV
jgi:hypothetical protein